MPETNQPLLSLRGGLQATFNSASDRLHATIKQVIRANDIKQGDDFAESLGVSGSHFSEALSGRGAKHFSLRWLPRVLVIDREHLFLKTCADLVDMKVGPKRPLTAAQKLELFKAEVRAAGGDVDAIEARAYARRAPWDEEETR